MKQLIFFLILSSYCSAQQPFIYNNNINIEYQTTNWYYKYFVDNNNYNANTYSVLTKIIELDKQKNRLDIKYPEYTAKLLMDIDQSGKTKLITPYP